MTGGKPSGLEKHYRIGQAAEILGLAPVNIRTHIKAGKIAATKTPGGHWRIAKSELLRLIGRPLVKQGKTNACVIYARVSSQKQKEAGNLQRQVERLHKFARDQQLDILDSIKEVGSGLDENRKGLIKLFRLAREQQMNYVLIEFRDRLTRSGYRYITDYLLLNGVEVFVKENETKQGLTDEDLNTELVEDPIAIISSFSGKLYDPRSAQFRKLRQCAQQIGEKKAYS